jgi:hypothetical protein
VHQASDKKGKTQLATKGGWSANKFRKSANLYNSNLVEGRHSANVALSGFAICGPHIFVICGVVFCGFAICGPKLKIKNENRPLLGLY